ncbi:MAG: hypothetical protein H5U05_09370 [Candidatus Aminicenantes bacterium]|nr:hypothetical protein [Candidatus Aminicenantes bacterium]
MSNRAGISRAGETVGWAEATGLGRERQHMFTVAVRTAGVGKARAQIAAIRLDYLSDDGPEMTTSLFKKG